MTRGQKMTLSLLGAIAVLLALNVVTASNHVFAQQEKVPLLAVTPVAITVASEQRHGENEPRWLVFRLWSDGTVDVNHVGEEDLRLPRPCDGENSLTPRVECFPGWQAIE